MEMPTFACASACEIEINLIVVPRAREGEQLGL